MTEILDTIPPPHGQGRAGRSGHVPDFFIVGAPKCGTTALDAYLREHPQIFMAPKEQHFFGSDLEDFWNYPVKRTRPSPEKYFSQFRDCGEATVCGESSVFYLWSRRAAAEIHACNPGAKIIVMLRNPVEMLPSLHSQYLYSGIEDLDDFGEAFAAEADRRAGRRIPPNSGPHPWRLFYRDMARFDVQLERYIEIFGRAQVDIILFDDFTRRPEETFRDTLAFLGVDPDVPTSFPVVNPNKRVRSSVLRRMTWRVANPPPGVRRLGRRVLPLPGPRRALIRSGLAALWHVNTAVEPRAPLPEDTRRAVAAELAPDIRRLGELLGRDLSSWYSG